MEAQITQKLRATAKELLSSQKVKAVIGYQQGSENFLTIPALVDSVEDVDKLIWGALCFNELSKYLIKPETPLPAAIVAKGCDSRNIVELIKANQISREQVFVLGIPCGGVIDPKKLSNQVNLCDFQGINYTEDGKLSVQTNSGINIIAPQLLLSEQCVSCEYPNPTLYDVLLAETLPPRALIEAFKKEIKQLEELLGKSGSEALRKYWQQEFGRCIRCGACREVCPACFCGVSCILDSVEPVWVYKYYIELQQNWLYLLIRAYHVAGRCTDCGACERSCPLRLKLRKLNRKLEKVILEKFNYIAGLDLEAPHPLQTYQVGEKLLL